MVPIVGQTSDKPEASRKSFAGKNELFFRVEWVGYSDVTWEARRCPRIRCVRTLTPETQGQSKGGGQ